MEQRGCGEARVAGVLNALRSLLKFCRDVGFQALDPREVRVPRIPRREVVYLTKEEVEQFLSAIVRPAERLEKVPVGRVRFRALVEVLLGTGARISEILSLDRSDVDFERKQAKIIGKEDSSGCSSSRIERWSGSGSIWLAVGMTTRLYSSAEGSRLAD